MFPWREFTSIRSTRLPQLWRVQKNSQQTKYTAKKGRYWVVLNVQKFNTNTPKSSNTTPLLFVVCFLHHCLLFGNQFVCSNSRASKNKGWNVVSDVQQHSILTKNVEQTLFFTNGSVVWHSFSREPFLLKVIAISRNKKQSSPQANRYRNVHVPWTKLP